MCTRNAIAWSCFVLFKIRVQQGAHGKNLLFRPRLKTLLRAVLPLCSDFFTICRNRNKQKLTSWFRLLRPSFLSAPLKKWASLLSFFFVRAGVVSCTEGRAVVVRFCGCYVSHDVVLRTSLACVFALDCLRVVGRGGVLTPLLYAFARTGQNYYGNASMHDVDGPGPNPYQVRARVCAHVGSRGPQ